MNDDGYKICTDSLCDKAGLSQPPGFFYQGTKRCKVCVERDRKMGASKSEIYRVEDLHYKIGDKHPHVFTWLDDHWIRSQITEAELMRAVRNG